MSNIKMIKQDAAIQVVISSGFLQKIQAIVVHMVNERTDEELTTFLSYHDLFFCQQQFVSFLVTPFD